MMVMGKSTDHLAATVASLIEGIEHDPATGTWSAPWQRIGVDLLTPLNAATGRHYTGVNRWMLAFAARATGRDGGIWATYRQWASLGAQVRKGERSIVSVLRPVVVPIERDDEDEDTRLVFRASAVFHADQVDGWAAPDVDLVDADPIPDAEALVNGWKASGMQIIEGGDTACYLPVADEIRVPRRGQFDQIEHFYATLAHEAAHWTGPRLGRDLTGRFGSDAYGAEELVAELTAAVISAEVGIAPVARDDHARYIASWLRILKADPRHLWSVASQAERAAEMLLDMGAAAEPARPASPSAIDSARAAA